MIKKLYDYCFIIRTGEEEHISIKDIKKAIDSLEILGVTDYKIKCTIRIDEEKSKNVPENVFGIIWNSWSNDRIDEVNLEILSDKYVNISVRNNEKYKIKVNIDDSYEYEDKIRYSVLNEIKQIKIEWQSK